MPHTHTHTNARLSLCTCSDKHQFALHIILFQLDQDSCLFAIRTNAPSKKTSSNRITHRVFHLYTQHKTATFKISPHSPPSPLLILPPSPIQTSPSSPPSSTLQHFRYLIQPNPIHPVYLPISCIILPNLSLLSSTYHASPCLVCLFVVPPPALHRFRLPMSFNFKLPLTYSSTTSILPR